MSAPERTCVGCRRRRPRASLVRLVRARSGVVAVDRHGARPGRGAYVCADDVACVERALKPGRLAHAFWGTSVVDAGLDIAVKQALRR